MQTDLWSLLGLLHRKGCNTTGDFRPSFSPVHSSSSFLPFWFAFSRRAQEGKQSISSLNMYFLIFKTIWVALVFFKQQQRNFPMVGCFNLGCFLKNLFIYRLKQIRFLLRRTVVITIQNNLIIVSKAIVLRERNKVVIKYHLCIWNWDQGFLNPELVGRILGPAWKPDRGCSQPGFCWFLWLLSQTQAGLLKGRLGFIPCPLFVAAAAETAAGPGDFSLPIDGRKFKVSMATFGLQGKRGWERLRPPLCLPLKGGLLRYDKSQNIAKAGRPHLWPANRSLSAFSFRYPGIQPQALHPEAREARTNISFLLWGASYFFAVQGLKAM